MVNNREKVRKAYYQRNKEEKIQKQKEYYEKNKEKVREYFKQYYNDNKEYFYLKGKERDRREEYRQRYIARKAKKLEEEARKQREAENIVVKKETRGRKKKSGLVDDTDLDDVEYKYYKAPEVEVEPVVEIKEPEPFSGFVKTKSGFALVW
jgi:hypothetical protein